MLTSNVLGLDLAALAKLAEEFPVTDIKYDKVKPDGFKPRYIDWPQISGRLNEAFGGGWNFEVLKWEWLPCSVVVQGRLSVQLVSMVDGHAHAWTMYKDGIGSAEPARNPAGVIIDQGYDLKCAATDALKRAAILLGVGIQLYNRQEVAQDQAVQYTQSANEMLDAWAQPFQLSAVIDFFEARQNIARDYWMRRLGLNPVLGLDMQLTARLANEVLSGTHPFAQEIFARTGVAPSGAVRSTNA